MLKVDGNTWTSGKNSGTIREMKGGFLFIDDKKKAFMCLVNKGHNERFFVSAGEVEGKIYYMYGLSEYDARIAGIHDLSYSGKSELADRILEQLKG